MGSLGPVSGRPRGALMSLYRLMAFQITKIGDISGAESPML